MLVAAGTDNGVALLALTGDTWSLRAHGLYGQKVSDLIKTPIGVYACASNGLVYRTGDWDRWEPMFEGLTGSGVHSLAAAHGLIFAGMTPPMLFRSEDGGRNWVGLPGFTKVPGRDKWTSSAPPYRPRVCRLLAFDNGLVVAGVEDGGLLLSPDLGQRWAERCHGLPPTVNDLAMPEAETILVTTRIGLFRSRDLGGTWEQLKGGLPYDYTRGVACDAQDPRRALVGVRTSQGSGSLVRTLDGGFNWEVCSRGLPALKDEAFSRLFCGPGFQLAGTTKGQLFWSRDFGDLWMKVGVNLPPIGGLLLEES